MDATISQALEEICSRGKSGVALSDLWLALEPSLAAVNLDLCPGLKQAIWTGLLAVPSLRFEPRAVASSSAAEAEEIGANVAADDQLRDSFLGLYNPRSANAALPPPQRRALERLAAVRFVSRCFYVVSKVKLLRFLLSCLLYGDRIVV